MIPPCVLFFGLFLALFLAYAPLAQAQSILESLPTEQEPEEAAPAPTPPPAATPENFTVTGVNADVTADNAAHARDQALMQAERSALSQLFTRAGAADTSSKMTDDAVASLVQSFEVQSEHVSSVRYIGVFTVRFKPAATQKKIGKSVGADPNASPDAALAVPVKAAPSDPLSHLMVSVQTGSLGEWAGIKKRLNADAHVAQINVVDLGRGTSHIDLSYGGSTAELQNSLTDQGLVLRQVGGQWQLYDGSMTSR